MSYFNVVFYHYILGRGFKKNRKGEKYGESWIYYRQAGDHSRKRKEHDEICQ